MFFKKKLELDAYILSDIGYSNIRNEDRSLFAYSINPDISLFLAIADGVRLNPSGEIAAKQVIDKIEQYHINRNRKDNPGSHIYKEFLIDAIKKINLEMLELSKKISSYYGMASTFAISTITKSNKLICLSVGDCGVFLCRRNSIRKLCGLYSIRDTLRPEEVVFGISKTIKYEMKIININKNDLIIITSDGAFKNNSFYTEILEVNSMGKSAKFICNYLVKKAIEKKINDNITIGVILVK